MGLRDFIRGVLQNAVASVDLNMPTERLFDNIRRNVKRGLPVVQEIPPHDKVAILVGGGPSLADDVEEIRRGQSLGQVVFAQNGAAAFLVSHGIVPDYQVIVDGRQQTAALVCPEAKSHLICSHCDPATVERAPGATLFHPNVDGIDELVPAEPCLFIGGSWTVGLVNMALAFGLGYRIERLFGYDSSVRAVDQDMQTGRYSLTKHHAYPQRLNSKEAGTIEVVCGGERFITTPALHAQAHGFKLLAMALMEQGCAVAVYGTGLIPTIARMMTRTQPSRGELRVAYPMNTHPASWNFYEWLINIEIYRRSNCYSSLSVSFTEGPKEGFRDDPFTDIPTEDQRQIINHVCRPLIGMFGAVEGDGTDIDETVQIPYTMKFAVDLFAAGQPLPEPEVSEEAAAWAEQYRGAHVITLREASYWPIRNSDLGAWLKFAAVLEANGERVVFVRDTAKSDWPLVGHEICPEASRNVDFRLALYRVADMNYMVSNGPCTLAMYSTDIPYICFMKTCSELDLHGNWFTMFQGINPGTQWPWATDRQKMIWRQAADGHGPTPELSDTFEEIMRAAGLMADPREAQEREKVTA